MYGPIYGLYDAVSDVQSLNEKTTRTKFVVKSMQISAVNSKAQRLYRWELIVNGIFFAQNISVAEEHSRKES